MHSNDKATVSSADSNLACSAMGSTCYLTDRLEFAASDSPDHGGGALERLQRDHVEGNAPMQRDLPICSGVESALGFAWTIKVTTPGFLGLINKMTGSAQAAAEPRS